MNTITSFLIWQRWWLALALFKTLLISTFAQMPTHYVFGNPNGAEQLQIELLNRARANPTAEGIRLANSTDPVVQYYFSQLSVNLGLMQSEFASLTPQAPLAPNALLTNGARSHSQWMYDAGQESYDELPDAPGGSSSERLTAAGYPWSVSTEIIYAKSSSPGFTHVAYEVDWAVDTDGMIPSRPHRTLLHANSFREIGVGLLEGARAGLGPELNTEVLATQANAPVLATGVVYYDLNANNFYDLGEALPNVTITALASTYDCVSAEGGGWVLPFPSTAGARSVTFTGPHLSATRSFSIPASLANVKQDLALTYTPPAFTSPAAIFVGATVPATFTNVPGFAKYRFRRSTKAAAPPENCEDATQVQPTISTGYALVNTNVHQQGTASFHLVMPDFADQIVELKGLYLGGGAPSLSFFSRLGWATPGQNARVEGKAEGSSAWTVLYSQIGSGGQGEITWKARSAALQSLAGKLFRLRLRYTINLGAQGYNQTDDTIGWFVDTMQFTDVARLNFVDESILTTESTSNAALAAGTYVLTAEPQAGSNNFPPGYQVLKVAPPTPYQLWGIAAENTAGLPVGTISLNPQADADGDGQSNVSEYAFSTSPTLWNPASTQTPQLRHTTTMVNYDYVKNTALPDLTLTPQILAHGASLWTSPGQNGAPGDFLDTILSTVGSLEMHRASVPLTTAQQGLFRLAFTLN